MSDVSLLDVVRPYFFVGMDLGPGVHEVLELLHVDNHDVAWDDDAVVLTGVARIDSTNPDSPLFSPYAGGRKPAAGADVPVWSFHDVSVGFRLTVPRRPAAALVSANVSDPGVTPRRGRPRPRDAERPVGRTGHAVPAGPALRAGLLHRPPAARRQAPGAPAGSRPRPPDGLDPPAPDPADRHPGLRLGHRVRRPSLGSWGAETLDDADPRDREPAPDGADLRHRQRALRVRLREGRRRLLRHQDATGPARALRHRRRLRGHLPPRGAGLRDHPEDRRHGVQHRRARLHHRHQQSRRHRGLGRLQPRHRLPRRPARRRHPALRRRRVDPRPDHRQEGARRPARRRRLPGDRPVASRTRDRELPALRRRPVRRRAVRDHRRQRGGPPRRPERDPEQRDLRRPGAPAAGRLGAAAVPPVLHRPAGRHPGHQPQPRAAAGDRARRLPGPADAEVHPGGEAQAQARPAAPGGPRPRPQGARGRPGRLPRGGEARRVAQRRRHRAHPGGQRPVQGHRGRGGRPPGRGDVDRHRPGGARPGQGLLRVRPPEAERGRGPDERRRRSGGSPSDSLDLDAFVQLDTDAPDPKPQVRVDAFASLEASANVALQPSPRPTAAQRRWWRGSRRSCRPEPRSPPLAGARTSTPRTRAPTHG